MYMGPEFDDYLKGIGEELTKMGAKPWVVKYVLRKNYFRIKTAFYEDDNPETIINLLKRQVVESIESQKLIIESSKMDLTTRTVVRDLFNLIKNNGDDTPSSYYQLPEDVPGNNNIYYRFNNIPEYAVELTVKNTDEIESDYIMDASVADDNETIEIVVLKKPNALPQSGYDMIADLNDIVRHEMEHILQDFGYRDVKSSTEEKPLDKEYYKQAHEVPAEIAGFRRIVKLRKEPVEKVIGDWFKRNKEVHQLPDEDIQELVDFLTKKYKEFYGR